MQKQLNRLKQQIKQEGFYNAMLNAMHLDPVLLFLLTLLALLGLVILYSASHRDGLVVRIQTFHFLIAFMLMLFIAQIPPAKLQRFAVWFYGTSLSLLLLVLIVGHVGKGAQRWLNLWVMHLQPAELMKIAIPLILARTYHQIVLPVKLKSIVIALPLILIPATLTAKQPDLGTAILMVIGGLSVLFLAGLPIKLITTTGAGLLASMPFVWFFLHHYQRQRVLTFFNPERDPLGAGYHIIQSKIAIGSGGLFGKGWLNGTQSSLHFLPEHTTDFIFAVLGEEFGLIGCLCIILLFSLIILRGLYITSQAQDTFSRLLAGSITIVFFISCFMNMSMVTGLLPVVGIPLPLISYGGSSLVTMMASFGILMSIQTHRKLLPT